MNYRPREMKLRLSCLLLATQKATSWIGPAPVRKRSFKSAYISRTLISFGRSTSHWPESGEAHSACVRRASKRFQEPDSKPCPGHTSAVGARSGRALKGVERTETHLSTAGRLLFQAELTLSLQPIIQLKARGSTPVEINLVGSLANLLVSHFASESFCYGFLRHHFLRLGCCWLGHRPPPGMKGLGKIPASTIY